MAHAGGCFPYIAGRVARSDGAEPLRSNAPAGVAAYLGRLYYNVAVSCHPTALPSLLTVTDADHLIFGTDYPAFSRADVDGAIAWLREESGFDAAQLAAIGAANARPLFPRLAAALDAAG